MPKINRLSQCKTLDDFNEFSTQIKFKETSKGRFFIFTDKDGNALRRYTMNQMTHRFVHCVNTSERFLKSRKALKEYQFKVIQGYEILQKLNKNTIQKPTWRQKMHKRVGNIFYSMTHRGPSKKIAIAKIQKKYPSMETLVDEAIKKTDLTRNFQNSDEILTQLNSILDTFQIEFSKHYFLLSEALEEPLIQTKLIDHLMKRPLERTAILAYAKKYDLKKFTNQYIIRILEDTIKNNADSENLFNLVDAALTEEGFSFKEICTNRELLESNVSFFQNLLLKEALIDYSITHNCYQCLNFYFDITIRSKASEISERGLVEVLYKELGINAGSLKDILQTPKNYPNLFKSPFILPELVAFARENNLFHFLYVHFEDLAERITKKLSQNYYHNEWDLVDEMESEFKREGRSINEILKNPDIFRNATPQSVSLDNPFILKSLVSYAKFMGHTNFLKAQLHYLFNKMKTSFKPPLLLPSSLRVKAYASSIEAFFTANGRSLGEILDNSWNVQNPDSRKDLFGPYFCPIMIDYARTHNISVFLDDHLKFLLNKLNNDIITKPSLKYRYAYF